MKVRTHWVEKILEIFRIRTQVLLPSNALPVFLGAYGDRVADQMEHEVPHILALGVFQADGLSGAERVHATALCLNDFVGSGRCRLWRVVKLSLVRYCVKIDQLG